MHFNTNNISVHLNKATPTSYADMINQMAKHLQSNEAAPNHWEPIKLEKFYAEFMSKLTCDSRDMLKRLIVK